LQPPPLKIQLNGKPLDIPRRFSHVHTLTQRNSIIQTHTAKKQLFLNAIRLKREAGEPLTSKEIVEEYITKLSVDEKLVHEKESVQRKLTLREKYIDENKKRSKEELQAIMHQELEIRGNTNLSQEEVNKRLSELWAILTPDDELLIEKKFLENEIKLISEQESKKLKIQALKAQKQLILDTIIQKRKDGEPLSHEEIIEEFMSTLSPQKLVAYNADSVARKDLIKNRLSLAHKMMAKDQLEILITQEFLNTEVQYIEKQNKMAKKALETHSTSSTNTPPAINIFSALPRVLRVIDSDSEVESDGDFD
jgi:hypothetical protein